MESTAQICLSSRDAELRFDWLGFDGDDCFREFSVTYRSGADEQRFEFGPCAVRGLRKLSCFFSDPAQESAGMGFRNPDIRYCDISREAGGYRVVVRYDGNGLHEEFLLGSPSLHMENKFLKDYYGDDDEG